MYLHTNEIFFFYLKRACLLPLHKPKETQSNTPFKRLHQRAAARGLRQSCRNDDMVRNKGRPSNQLQGNTVSNRYFVRTQDGFYWNLSPFIYWEASWQSLNWTKIWSLHLQTCWLMQEAGPPTFRSQLFLRADFVGVGNEEPSTTEYVLFLSWEQTEVGFFHSGRFTLSWWDTRPFSESASPFTIPHSLVV